MKAFAKLHLEVHTAQCIGVTVPGSYLYEHGFGCAFLPGEGAIINDGSMAFLVKRREWAMDGTVTIMLVPFHVDPTEEMLPHCMAGYRAAWWTEDDGDLHQTLLDGGWTKVYGEPAREAA